MPNLREIRIERSSTVHDMWYPCGSDSYSDVAAGADNDDDAASCFSGKDPQGFTNHSSDRKNSSIRRKRSGHLSCMSLAGLWTLPRSAYIRYLEDQDATFTLSL